MANKNTRKDKFSYEEKEMELASKLAQEMIYLGINLTPRQRREIINFIRIRTYSLDLQNTGLDKRSLEKDLQFRIATLKQVSKQIARDHNPYDLKDDEFIKRQIFLALVETASLIQERKIKSNIRDGLAMDLHLWVVNQMIMKHGIVKSAHVLASILKKVGYWRGRGASLKVATIQNKILRANKLVQDVIERGACHPIEVVSDSPRWHSEAFVLTLSQGCSKCSKIWIKTLGLKGTKDTPWMLAVLELKKEVPSLGEQIKFVSDALIGEGEQGMPLAQIIDYLPRKYQGSFQHLFEARLFV